MKGRAQVAFGALRLGAGKVEHLRELLLEHKGPQRVEGVVGRINE